ncbi:MAG: T9SS type A sorting domain-containing protein [Ignavibacteriales bacterium]|nr:T9SS type A sorting domain-containing protein [Ignavibacteriales bacterium]
MKNHFKIILLTVFLCQILSVENISQTKVDHFSNENYLPVELIYFYPQITANVVWLYWGTATEVNNYGYDIERSDSSQNWEAIGFVLGHGNSFSPKDYNFEDSTLTKNGIYFYRLKQIDTDGGIEYSDTVRILFSGITSVEINNTVTSFRLNQNYPNPFNPSTIISWQLPANGNVSLKIYDVFGREISTLIDDEILQRGRVGKYQVEFNSAGLASGIYFYKMEFQSSDSKYISVRKMNFIK